MEKASLELPSISVSMICSGEQAPASTPSHHGLYLHKSPNNPSSLRLLLPGIWSQQQDRWHTLTQFWVLLGSTWIQAIAFLIKKNRLSCCLLPFDCLPFSLPWVQSHTGSRRVALLAGANIYPAYKSLPLTIPSITRLPTATLESSRALIC